MYKRQVKTRNVTWNIGFNATHYRNKISRLAESKKTDIIDGHAGYVNGLYYYGEGLPMYTNYVQKYAGVSEEGKPQWYYTDKQTGEMKTTTTYSQADLYLCGDAVPDLYGGINTSLSFYGFDFSAQINYSIGGCLLYTSPSPRWLPSINVTSYFNSFRIQCSQRYL